MEEGQLDVFPIALFFRLSYCRVDYDPKQKVNKMIQKFLEKIKEINKNEDGNKIISKKIFSFYLFFVFFSNCFVYFQDSSVIDHKNIVFLLNNSPFTVFGWISFIVHVLAVSIAFSLMMVIYRPDGLFGIDFYVKSLLFFIFSFFCTKMIYNSGLDLIYDRVYNIDLLDWHYYKNTVYFLGLDVFSVLLFFMILNFVFYSKTSKNKEYVNKKIIYNQIIPFVFLCFFVTIFNYACYMVIEYQTEKVNEYIYEKDKQEEDECLKNIDKEIKSLRMHIESIRNRGDISKYYTYHMNRVLSSLVNPKYNNKSNDYIKIEEVKGIVSEYNSIIKEKQKYDQSEQKKCMDNCFSSFCYSSLYEKCIGMYSETSPICIKTMDLEIMSQSFCIKSNCISNCGLNSEQINFLKKTGYIR